MPQNTDEFITTLADDRLRVLAPFNVRFLVEGGSVAAEAPEVNEFGFGSTLAEAVQDLRVAITELYLTLRDDRGRLGPDLRKVWEDLQRKVHISHMMVDAIEQMRSGGRKLVADELVELLRNILEDPEEGEEILPVPLRAMAWFLVEHQEYADPLMTEPDPDGSMQAE